MNRNPSLLVIFMRILFDNHPALLLQLFHGEFKHSITIVTVIPTIPGSYTTYYAPNFAKHNDWTIRSICKTAGFKYLGIGQGTGSDALQGCYCRMQEDILTHAALITPISSYMHIYLVPDLPLVGNYTKTSIATFNLALQLGNGLSLEHNSFDNCQFNVPSGSTGKGTKYARIGHDDLTCYCADT